MGDVVHLHHGTPAGRLAEIEAEVFRAIDHMALRVGELLHEARELDPAGFAVWVDERMPFGMGSAKRLMAIHLAYRELPAEVKANLPRPWQALYALRKWADGRLTEALESGEVGPSTTTREALETARTWTRGQWQPTHAPPRYSSADLFAGKLMGFEPDELDENVFIALTRWIGRRRPDLGR
jgi:hypothetical protein